MNNFEKWKAELDINLEADRRNSIKVGDICFDCPALNHCENSYGDRNRDCGKLFKEWGERDERN